MKGFRRNLAGSKILTSCVFRADWKTKITALDFDCLRYFYISSATAERNSTKLDNNLVLNGLFQVYIFGPVRKPRRPWPLIGCDMFNFSSGTAVQNSTKLDSKQVLNIRCQVLCFHLKVRYSGSRAWPFLPLVFVFNRSENTDDHPDWLRHFGVSSATAEWILTKQVPNALYHVCVFFRAHPSRMMTTLAFYWLRQFRLLCNR